ncbi:MAG: hypothetical protein AAF357_17340 [Verrucomicrobiota bacterium]
MDKLLSEIEAGKKIESGSGGGGSATYKHDSLEEMQARLDSAIDELRRRSLNGDTDVPEVYSEITPIPDTVTADFSGH